MTSAAPLGWIPGTTGTGVLAHQGGWDEILLVAGPLAVVAVMLWVANRRVSKQLAEATDEAPGDLIEGDQIEGGSSETEPRS